MIRIGVRELRQHASRYLARVKAGEVVEVTERGTLVALLVSPNPSVSERDRLVTSGRLAPATASFRLPEHRHSARTEHDASDALSDLREDRPH